MTDLREKVAREIERLPSITVCPYEIVDAVLAIARPDGFVLVPIEPTEEMLAMAFKLDAEWYPLKNRVGRLQLIKAYRAMISATSEPLAEKP